MPRFCFTTIFMLLLAACDGEAPPSTSEAPAAEDTPAAEPDEVVPSFGFDPRHDYHSFADPDAYVTRHLDLDLTVDFGSRILSGTAALELERRNGGTLVLDTRDLTIEQVEAASGDGRWQPAEHSLGEHDELLGTPLAIELPADADRVRIRYRTSPEASGLQWLGRELTADRTQPFLFTQSQALHARSWIPLQDTPSVRMTYSARIRTPETVLALMSAENEPDAVMDGDYTFEMPQPIPSYLMALAVGDVRFARIGPRTGVYAEPSVIDAAAEEFEDTEAMLETAEGLFGPYRWGRYDLLILPPSFPYGGMENPRLTFATPTIIAGDKSLVSLVAHELAHSWSGNLVSNATWRDFWLNEGTTTYFTHRIMKAVYGEERTELEMALEAQDLREALEELPDDKKPLATDPRGLDPEEIPSAIAYDAGALFHHNLQHAFGREAYDRFLASWFDRYAFESVTTEDFLRLLHEQLIEPNPGAFPVSRAREWIYEPGIPEETVWPETDAFEPVDRQRAAWVAGELSVDEIDTADWTVHHWRRFISLLPDDLPAQRMAELDERFDLTGAGNKMIARDWFIEAVEHEYEAAYPAIEEHLTSVGRMLLITPIYEALAETREGRAFAERAYAAARPAYHPIARASVERALAQAEAADEDEESGAR